MIRLPKSFADWMTFFKKDWPSRSVLTLLSLSVAFIWAQGKDTVKTIAKTEGSKIALEAVKPSLDSFKVVVDTLKSQVQELQGQVDTLRAGQEKQGRIQQEFFGAMMDVIPGLKKEVQARGKQSSAVVIKKAEANQLLESLTEIK